MIYYVKNVTPNRKLIILDNASSHRNQQIKDLINKHNNILYAVPYQHFHYEVRKFYRKLL